MHAWLNAVIGFMHFACFVETAIILRLCSPVDCLAHTCFQNEQLRKSVQEGNFAGVNMALKRGANPNFFVFRLSHKVYSNLNADVVRFFCDGYGMTADLPSIFDTCGTPWEFAYCEGSVALWC